MMVNATPPGSPASCVRSFLLSYDAFPKRDLEDCRRRGHAELASYLLPIHGDRIVAASQLLGDITGRESFPDKLEYFAFAWRERLVLHHRMMDRLT